MKRMILVLFLAIPQTPSPAPQKATDSATSAAHAVPRDANDNRTPISPSPSVAVPVAVNPDESASNTPKHQDAPQSVRVRELPPVSVTKDWADRGVWAFSGLLVIVGILQICVLLRQAKIMGEHARHLENLAIAAKDNAKAARENAGALINSERAWILVRTRPTGPHKKRTQWFWSDGRPLTTQETMGGAHLKPELIGYTIKNYGRTPGWVTAHWSKAVIVRGVNELPRTPDYFSKACSISIEKCDALYAPYAPKAGRKTTIYIPPDDLSPVSRRESFLYVYGIISYRDVWDGEHETRFCFYWHVPDSVDINPQGFYQEGPEGYNKTT